MRILMVVLVGCGSAPAPAPAPAPVGDHHTPDGRLIVPPTALEPYRIAGNKTIKPTEAGQREMAEDGLTKIVARFGFCVTAAGDVTDVARLEASGIASYDATLEQGLHAWRYRPYIVAGAPQAVCTNITFVYSMN